MTSAEASAALPILPCHAKGGSPRRLCASCRKFPPRFQQGLRSYSITLRSFSLAHTRDLTCPSTESVRPLPPAPRIPFHSPFEHLSGDPTAQGNTGPASESKAPIYRAATQQLHRICKVSYLYKLSLSGHLTVAQTIPYRAAGWLTSRKSS